MRKSTLAKKRYFNIISRLDLKNRIEKYFCIYFIVKHI